MRALAERLGPTVTAQTISKYEAGKRLPSSAVLVALAKALDVSLDFLMSAQIETLEGFELPKHSATSARDRARAEVILIDHLERCLAVEQVLGLHASTEGVERHRHDGMVSESGIDREATERLEQLVWRAVGEELISPIRAAELLGKPLAYVEQQISGPLAR